MITELSINTVIIWSAIFLGVSYVAFKVLAHL